LVWQRDFDGSASVIPIGPVVVSSAGSRSPLDRRHPGRRQRPQRIRIQRRVWRRVRGQRVHRHCVAPLALESSVRARNIALGAWKVLGDGLKRSEIIW